MCASAQKDTTKRQVINIALQNGIFLGIEVWFRWLYAQKIKNLGTRGGFPRLCAQIIFLRSMDFFFVLNFIYHTSNQSILLPFS